MATDIVDARDYYKKLYEMQSLLERWGVPIEPFEAFIIRVRRLAFVGATS